VIQVHIFKRTMNKIRIPFLILSFIALPTLLFAQAWTKKKGTGFYKIDFTGNNAVNVFNATREFVTSPQIRNYTSSIYAEYGLTDKFTLVTYVPFLVNNSLSKGTTTFNIPSSSNNKIGDIDLAGRFALPFKKIPIALTLQLGLPTGDSKNIDGLNTGDGEFNQMLKIATGIGKKKLWIQTAAGFNNRSKNNSDEVRYDLEFGYKFLNERLLTILRVNGVESLKNGTAKESALGLYSNNVGYAGFGPEFLYYFTSKKNMGFSTSLRHTVPSRARNVLAASSFSFGIFASL
jgi:protein XagA